jgi:hypothetical protein
MPAEISGLENSPINRDTIASRFGWPDDFGARPDVRETQRGKINA